LAIVPQLNFGNSSPLILGYSRGTRFKNILDKLFFPRLFGNPNPQVLYNLSLLNKHFFSNGGHLLNWLSALPIANKNYQCTHYYFIFVTKPTVFPKPPHIDIIHKLEKAFTKIENKFLSSGKEFKSFFSYNWVLRKIMGEHNLDYFLQFVKPIKCKRRLQKYTNMYNEIMSADNVVEAAGNSQNCQIKPALSQGGASGFLQRLLFFSNLVARKSHYTVAPSSS
jgi:hypothetical protein